MTPEHQVFMVRHLALVLLLSLLVGPVGPAFAQSNACRQLNARLVSLSSEPDYVQAKSFSSAVRKQKSQLKRTERRYVRGGCNKQAKAGVRLTGQCRALGNQINAQRRNLDNLQTRAALGVTISNAREATLQQIARYNCNNGRTTRTVRTTRRSTDRPRNLLEAIFGVRTNRKATSQQLARGFIEDENYGFRPYFGDTVRSLCVRTCDGYYWPVSFSTSEEFLGDDAALCQQQCPSAEVELYYHRNPGEDADDMVSMTGASYAELPNAFAYRKKFDASCSCKSKVNFGTIALETSGETNITHAVINFDDLSVPLPPKDPRRRIQAIELALSETVPLPRRRPGSEPLQPVTTTVAESTVDRRTFKFEGKTIRLVGPKTPYVPTGAEES